MKKLCALFLFLFLFNSFAEAQVVDSTNFVTDRPGVATPPDIVTLQSFQIENGFQYEKYSDGTILNENILFSSLLLRYGLFEIAEVRVQTDYAYTLQRDSSISSRIIGFNPVTIGTKIKLVEQRTIIPNVSLLLNLALPFIGEDEFRPEHAAPSCYLLLSNDLSDKLNLCSNYGLIWDGSSSIPSHFYALCIGMDVSNNVSIFLEGYGLLNHFLKPEHYADTGFGYLIANNLQVDFSIAGSLSLYSGYYLLNMGVVWEL
ncbi:MAG: transporter [Bacteroidota bacterium]|nr:transporter [Bacteroidota bacterium]